MTQEIRKVGIVGGGVIGAGWAARFALNGIDVSVYDPDPEIERKTTAVLANARRAMTRLFGQALPAEGTVTFAASLADAVRDADFIQESLPEREDLKVRLLAEMDAAMPAHAVIGSSTSGLLPTKLQAGMARPDRLVVGHPFNPVYLLPLVEICGGDLTSQETKDIAAAVYERIGMKVLHVRKEIDAHIADRFLEAVWREALWLIKDGIATTEEIDNAIRYGFGMRWAQMGLFETYRIAGGEAGMRHFIAQFGPCLSWPWTKLMDVPELTDDLINAVAGQSDEQSGAYSIRELERIRDNNLVTIMRGLKAQNWGSGKLLNAQDKRISRLPETLEDVADLSRPVVTVDRAVPLDWTDYNGHMNEARYLQAFGDATDRLMLMVGCTAEYISSGGSYFTAETHIRHIDEVHAGKRIHVETQVILGEGKKMHLFHRMYEGDRLCATGEHMLIHVSLETRKASVPAPQVAAALEKIAAAHKALPMPEGAGSAVGKRA